MNKFRNCCPSRTYKGTYKNYHKYKPHLAKDFSNRCGYTDCHDSWFGGKDCFHIDHFIPWKSHPENPSLKTDYSNLVYSCSYVNIAKSNDEGNYLDPCDEDYNEHFSKDSEGAIVANPRSKKAVYMHKKLRLYLRRYQVIWALEMLESKMRQLSDIEKDPSIMNKHKGKVQEMICKLMAAYLEYKEYLQST